MDPARPEADDERAKLDCGLNLLLYDFGKDVHVVNDSVHTDS